jgi:hypothetical protein
VQVRNNSRAVLVGWVIEASLPDGQTYSFGADNISANGRQLTIVANQDWMRNIAPQEVRGVSWFHVQAMSSGQPTYRCRALTAAGLPDEE